MGRRVGDEGLATNEKTANPILQLETSESDGTWFSPNRSATFQRNEKSQALSGWPSVGGLDRTGARIESTTNAGRGPALATTSQSTAAGLQIPAPASIRGLCRRLLFRKAGLVVECDGSAHNSNGQWQHDQVRNAYMLSQGLRVLRFSNDQILNDTETVLREIAEYLVPSDQEPSI